MFLSDEEKKEYSTAHGETEPPTAHGKTKPPTAQKKTAKDTKNKKSVLSPKKAVEHSKPLSLFDDILFTDTNTTVEDSISDTFDGLFTTQRTRKIDIPPSLGLAIDKNTAVKNNKPDTFDSMPFTTQRTRKKKDISPGLAIGKNTADGNSISISENSIPISTLPLDDKESQNNDTDTAREKNSKPYPPLPVTVATDETRLVHEVLDDEIKPSTTQSSNDMDAASFIKTVSNKDIKSGQTALHKAVEANNKELATSLCQQLSPIDMIATDKEGNTVLHLAAKLPDSDLLSFFLMRKEKEIDPNIQNIYGETPLHIAIITNQIENVRQLLNNSNVKLNIQTNNNSKKVKDKIKRLLPGSSSPLHYAFDNGWDLHITPDLPKNLKLYKNSFILVNHIDLYYIDPDGNTAKIMLNDLKKSDAFANLNQTKQDKVNLSYEQLDQLIVPNDNYPDFQRHFNPQIIKLLIERIAPVNLPNQNGDTPIHLAMASFCIDYINETTLRLMFGKHTWQTVNSEQKNALHVAAKNPEITASTFRIIVGYAHEDKILDNIDNMGNTPLWYASQKNDLQKIRILAEKKPNPNIFKRCSPLHLATKEGNVDIAQVLIDDLGADVNVKDNEGKLPFHYSVASGNPDLIRLMSMSKAKVNNELKKWAVEVSLLNNAQDALLELMRLFKADPNICVSLPKAQAKPIFAFVSTSQASQDEQNKEKEDIEKKFANKWLEENDNALFLAVRHNNEELAKACIESNSSVVNSINGDGITGKTPSQIAIKVLSPNLAHLLWKNGAKEGGGSTLMSQAAKRKFGSPQQLSAFFQNNDYELTEDQRKKRDKILESGKYRGPEPSKKI